MTANENNTGKHERILAEQRTYNSQRAAGYREQALKLYPWVCGRCAREFLPPKFKRVRGAPY